MFVESEQGSEAVGIELGEADYAAGLIAGHAGVAVFGSRLREPGLRLGRWRWRGAGDCMSRLANSCSGLRAQTTNSHGMRRPPWCRSWW